MSGYLKLPVVGGGSGAVSSVNGKVGAVVLNGTDIGPAINGTKYKVGPTSQYTTIQAALNAIGDAVDANGIKNPATVIIQAGTYDEDLTIPRGKIISLIAEGTVVLGDGLGSGWTSTNTRNITANYDLADVFGSSSRPCLTIGTLAPSDGTSTFMSYASGFHISGGINIAGSGLTHNIYLNGVVLYGNFSDVSTGLCNLLSFRTIFKGTITATNGILERMRDSQFNGLITALGYNCFLNCEIQAGMTVTANQNTLPPSGIFHTTLTGTFTTPALGMKMDAISDYYFTTNSATLGGSASKVILDSVYTLLGDKYVRTTRFAIISSGTSGTVTLPSNSTVILDDFGGTTDAIVTTSTGGLPTLSHAFTSSNQIVATSFDSSGNWVLTGTPSAYPVAILYRVKQKLSDFDSTASNIYGTANISDAPTEGNIVLSDVTTLNTSTTMHGFAPKLSGSSSQYFDGSGAWSTPPVPTDATISTSDITTNNTSTTKHGFAPKLSGSASQYLDGTGAWSAPATPSDATVTFTDITTNNASTTQHGFLKKLSGTATQFMDGTGNWTQPTGAGLAISDVTTNNATTSAHGFLPKLSGTATDFMNGSGAWATPNLLKLPESTNTSSPNATVPVVALTATDSATNVDIALIPKGTGSIMAQIPDGGNTNGNKRGTGSVDLQLGGRTAANQVVSGNNSFGVGKRNIVSGNTSIAAGDSNTSSGLGSVALGISNISSGTSTTSIGSNNTSIAAYSFATGFQSNAPTQIGKQVHASGVYSVVGDCQIGRSILRASTTDATVTTCTSDGNVAAANNQLTLTNTTTFAFTGMIVGKQIATSTNVGAWKVEGVIVRGANAAATTLVASTVTVISNAATFGTPTLSADTTLGCLKVTVTGIAATNIRWTVLLETAEVLY